MFAIQEDKEIQAGRCGFRREGFKLRMRMRVPRTGAGKETQVFVAHPRSADMQGYLDES